MFILILNLSIAENVSLFTSLQTIIWYLFGEGIFYIQVVCDIFATLSITSTGAKLLLMGTLPVKMYTQISAIELPLIKMRTFFYDTRYIAIFHNSAKKFFQ